MAENENNVTVGFLGYGTFIQVLKIAGIPVQEVPETELKKAGRLCLFVSGEYECPDHCYGYGTCRKNPCPCCERNCTQLRLLRISNFKTFQGEPMVAEEILRHQECGSEDCEYFSEECKAERESKKYGDCNIEKLLAIEFAIYPEGQRPNLVNEVKEPN